MCAFLVDEYPSLWFPRLDVSANGSPLAPFVLRFACPLIAGCFVKAPLLPVPRAVGRLRKVVCHVRRLARGICVVPVCHEQAHRSRTDKRLLMTSTRGLTPGSLVPV